MYCTVFFLRCQTMSYDGQFLHSLSTDSESLDSYTCRVSASVLTNSSFINGHINTSQWLKQVSHVRLNVHAYSFVHVHLCV